VTEQEAIAEVARVAKLLDRALHGEVALTAFGALCTLVADAIDRRPRAGRPPLVGVLRHAAGSAVAEVVRELQHRSPESKVVQ
jgi:hypothetical protein